MIETAWCVLVIVGALLLFGLPVQWLLNGRRPLEERDWVAAPFMAVAALVLAGQALAYGDVPLGRSAPWLWVGAALLGAWMVTRGGVRWRSVPVAVLGAALAVYLVHGCGLLLAGARWYVGRAWGDQFNYTVMAEFLRDQPYSLTFDQLGQRPYLFVPILMKQHRHGQSVLHAFFAASTFRGAKTLFEPMILLSPALVFLALHEVRRRLVGPAARGWALVTCAAAALLPGLALLHLEGFLSQCMALPLLLLWPVLLHDIAVDPGRRSLLPACLVMAAVTAIYGEVLPILLGLAVGGLGAAALSHPQRARLLAAVLVLPLSVLPFVLTPAWQGLLDTMRYVGAGVLGHLYPWAFRLEGLARIWCGDLVELDGASLRAVLQGTAVVLTLAGYLGLGHRLVRLSRGEERPADAAGSGARALAVSLGLVVLLPPMVLAQRGEHPYQFYKLALTIAPLVALGITLVPVARLRGPLVALMLSLALAGTAQMTWQAGRAAPGPRSMAEYLMSAEARGLADALEALRGRDLVLLQRDPEGRPPGVVNAWLTYLGRHNRVWLGNSVLNQMVTLASHPALRPISDLTSVPADAVFLTSRGDPWTSVPPGARWLWSSESYVLWQPTTGPWVTLLSVRNPNGLEEVRGQRFFWVGGEDSRLFVLAGQSGTLRLSAEYWIGPNTEGTRREVTVRTSGGHEQTFALGPGAGPIGVPVAQGAQELRLIPLDRGRPYSAQDARHLVLGVRGLELSLQPGP